ncbi:hypothetical protein LTR85_009101 [Meristemomyces frigidus]|nr:hypothetical protein LTR85_009101 [Meristemomyces frigidus]
MVSDNVDLESSWGHQDGKLKDINVLETEPGIDIEAAHRSKALDLLAHHHVNGGPHSLEAKLVLKKIDYRIMPLIFCVYVLMLVDKNSLSFSEIMGIKEATGLTANEYSWLGSLVYFGYLGGEIPCQYFMQRLPIGKYFSVMTMVWGMLVTMHATCHDFGGLATVRFLLGLIEVCTAPCVIYILGSWYTKQEQVTRVAIWYCSSGSANIVGGFFAWCIYQADSFRWQALFIFLGTLTFCVGVLLFFFMAATPMEASWLNEEEKTIALERVRDNKTGSEVWRFNRLQLMESFRDVRFYLIFLLLVSTSLPNGGITVFGFGFTDEQSTLLTMAPGAAAVLGTGLSWLLAKHTNRTIAGSATLVVAIIGVIMMLTIDESHYAARYGGYILTMQFPVSVLFVISFMTAGIGGTTKKLAFSASYQLGYTVGNIIGPQTYRKGDGPNYYTAKFTMLAFLIFTLILLISIGLIHARWNRKRDRQDELDLQNGVVHAHVENEEFADITDFNLRSFRYPV